VTNVHLQELQSAFQHGSLKLKGQFMLGSNYTFLVDVRHHDKTYPAVYKPSRGEQPLWDFPENSLAQREVAAYLVSEALGFGFVPFTTLRADGPHGAGSLQQYIEYDPEYHYFSFIDEDKAKLKPVVLFDLLINNADRKGSHVFFDNDSHKLWAIDHGICFHEYDKLRTVIWDFADESIPADLLSCVSYLPSDQNLLTDLEGYLSPREIAALKARAKALAASRVFPRPPQGRRSFPYPPL
jgi:uncharacterized repeat protein (TIGR03843 family)